MRLEAPSQVRTPSDLAFLALATEAEDSLKVDLGALEWISPLGVTGLLATCLNAVQKGISAIEVSLPRQPQVASYLREIGFCAELERQGWPSVDDVILPDPSVLPCLPVTQFTTEADVDDGTAVLHEALQGVLPAGMSQYIVDVAVELSANAREHGSPCYVVTQTHTGRTSGTPGVHLAVADFGRGFAETLAAFEPTSDADALRLGFEGGVSSTGNPHRGRGLEHVCDAIDAIDDSELWIVSRQGQAQRAQRELTTSVASYPLPGTFAAAYFPVDTALMAR